MESLRKTENLKPMRSVAALPVLVPEQSCCRSLLRVCCRHRDLPLPGALGFPAGATRALPRAPVRNVRLLCHSTEDRNGPYQGSAELVKSFLTRPTNLLWWGNKKERKFPRICFLLFCFMLAQS